MSALTHRPTHRPLVSTSGTVQIPDWYFALGVAGTAIGAYHGYKRNDSVGWAIAWAVLGGMFPIIVIPVAFAQGIDSRK